MVQWIRIHLPRQEKSVQSLIWEDPTRHGATKSVPHNYWSPHALEAVLSNKRSYAMRSLHIATKSSFRSSQLEKAVGSSEDPEQPKKKKGYRQPDLIGHCPCGLWSPLSSQGVRCLPVKSFASSPQSSWEESHEAQPTLKELLPLFNF